jgi:uncharacterized membrane-anchored protein YhcB (DUF1043 family)
MNRQEIFNLKQKYLLIGIVIGMVAVRILIWLFPLPSML